MRGVQCRTPLHDRLITLTQNGWTDGQLDGWADGLMDEWDDECE